MRRSAKLWATALGAALASIVAVSVLPTGAVAEQASQPNSAAAAGLDAGRYHSCATLAGAALRCWGYGGDAALGYGNRLSIGDDETPDVAGPVNLGDGAAVVAVSAGQVHTCALLTGGITGGRVRCWGFAGNGRLGYGNETIIGDNETPGSVGPVFLGADRAAVAITAGRAHSCAILDDAAVRCWGFAFDGRIGYPDLAPDPINGPRPANVGDDETPGSLPPVSVGAPATAISAGDSHTCAILAGGSVRCWGFAGNGQLGYGNMVHIGDDELPSTAGPVLLGAGRTAVAIAAGDFHTCVVLDDANVRCWGFGGNGRLGYGNNTTVGATAALTPDKVGPVNLGPGRTARAIAAGASHTCALLDNGTVRCWGFGANGQLGYGDKLTVSDPATAGAVDLGGRAAVAISAGGDHTCARLDDDSVRCWGSGTNGEIGNCARDLIGDDESPASIAPVNLGVPGVGGACPPASVTPPPPPPAAVPDTGAQQQPTTPTGAGDAAALRAEAARMADMRACRADVRRKARDERDAARRRYRRSSHERALLLRRAEIRAAVRRARCMSRFGRTPGRVTTVSARVSSSGRLIVLRFRAPGSDGSKPPAARGYLVKQSLRPIRTARDFARADALCKGTCRFKVTPVGASITLNVNQLRRRTTYYYAVAARDNVSNRPGPRSRTVSARTR
jgi:alpha-tubulin suppressor-like RCC1 family protein